MADLRGWKCRHCGLLPGAGVPARRCPFLTAAWLKTPTGISPTRRHALAPHGPSARQAVCSASSQSGGTATMAVAKQPRRAPYPRMVPATLAQMSEALKQRWARDVRKRVGTPWQAMDAVPPTPRCILACNQQRRTLTVVSLEVCSPHMEKFFPGRWKNSQMPSFLEAFTSRSTSTDSPTQTLFLQWRGQRSWERVLPLLHVRVPAAPQALAGGGLDAELPRGRDSGGEK